ncbi:MAG: glutathione binding-like protein [Ottowia sp.]
MKLYYSAGACSLAAHIALEEAGLKYEAISAPTKTKLLPDGSDYRQVNPLGYVPYLVLDDGQALRECAIVCQYVADQAPAKKLIPACGSMARYQLQMWMHFIATELHKGFSPLFNPAMPDEAKKISLARLQDRLKFVDGELAGKTYLMGTDFTVADGLPVHRHQLGASRWRSTCHPTPNLLAWRERVAARPAVQAAMKAEGLI